jgi:hypothetical protein
MAIVLPTRWQVQPSYPVELDYTNPLADGLVRAWPLGQNHWIDAVRNQPITATNGPSMVSTDRGEAARFVGASNQHAIESSLPVTDAFTMACWFNADDVTNAHSLMSFGVAGSSKRIVLFANGSLPGDNLSGSWVGFGTQVDPVTTTGFSAGRWHSAVLTATAGGSFAIYLDGGSKGTGSNTAPSLSTLNRTILSGRMNTTVGFPLYGRMQTPVVASRAWSDAEALEYQRNPYQIYRKRVARIYSFPSGGTSEGSGNVDGIGSLVGEGKATHSGSGEVSGVGSLVGTGLAVHSGSGTVDGIGSLVGEGEAPAVGAEGGGTVDGIGSLVGAGESLRSGSGTVDGIGSLVGEGLATHSGSGTVDGVGSLVGEGLAPSTSAEGSGTVDGIGSLVGAGAHVASGSGAIDGLGSLVGGGEISASGINPGLSPWRDFATETTETRRDRIRRDRERMGIVAPEAIPAPERPQERAKPPRKPIAEGNAFAPPVEPVARSEPATRQVLSLADARAQKEADAARILAVLELEAEQRRLKAIRYRTALLLLAAEA